MGNNSSTPSQGNASENVSIIQRPSRLSLNKSLQLTVSQNKDFKNEPDCQAESCLRGKYIRNENFSIPAAEVSEIITRQSPDYRHRFASNTKNSVSKITTEDIVLTMCDSNITETSESEYDTDTSSDNCSIVFTQTSLSENLHSGHNTVQKISRERSRIPSDSRARLEASQKCNISQHPHLDNCGSKTSYVPKVKKNCQNSSDTRGCIDAEICTPQQHVKKKNNVPNRKKGTNQNSTSFMGKTILDYFNSQEKMAVKGELNATLLSTDMKDEELSGSTTGLQESVVQNSFSQEDKDCLKNKTLSKTSDTYDLARSIIFSTMNNTSIEKLIKSSVSSLSEKQNSIKQQSIVISSDEEDAEPKHKQQSQTCHRQELDANNKASVWNRNLSNVCSLRRSSTLEYKYEDEQSDKYHQVTNSQSSSYSSRTISNNAVSTFFMNSSNSLSQEIPYQGECINGTLDQRPNNSDTSVTNLVTTSSHASMSSMPSLQKRPSSFYENKMFEDCSPPLLSQQLMISTLITSEKSNTHSTPSVNSNMVTKDNSSLVSANKIANEDYAEIDMYTEGSTPNTEQSDKVHGKVMDILSMLDSENGNLEDQNSDGKIQLQYVSNEGNAKEGLSLSIQQQAHEPSVSVGSVSPTERGSGCVLDFAIVKKEDGGTEPACVYSENNDGIYVLDSDDDEFFMSQSILGTTSDGEKEYEQSLHLVTEGIPKIYTNERNVEAESDSENIPTLKQLNNSKEIIVLNQSCSKVVDGTGFFDRNNKQDESDLKNLDSDKNLSDSEDLEDDVVPLSPLFNEGETSIKEQYSKTIGSKDSDFPNHYNERNDNNIIENKSPEQISMRDDNVAESMFYDDDDDDFLSQVDYVDNLYDVHTQVYSNDNLEQIKDENECRDDINEADTGIGDDRTDNMLDNVKKVKQLVLKPSKFCDNKVASSVAAIADCDTQEPFCIATQVYHSSITEEWGHIDALSASVSSDDDTQSPYNIDTNNAAELETIKHNPYECETLARSLSPDLERLFNTTKASIQLKTQDQCEAMIHAASPLLNKGAQRNHYSETANQGLHDREIFAASSSNKWKSLHNMTKQRNNSETATKDQCDIEILVVSSSGDDSDSVLTMARQRSFMPETKCNSRYEKESNVLLNKDIQSQRVTRAEEFYQETSKIKDPFEIMTLEAFPKEEMASSYNMSTQRTDLPEIEKQNPWDIETLSASSSEDSDCIFTMETQRTFVPETKCKNQYCKETLPSISLNEDTKNLFTTEKEENYSQVISKEKDSLELTTVETSSSKEFRTLLDTRTQINEEDQDPFYANTLTVSPSSSTDSESFFTTATQKFTSETKDKQYRIAFVPLSEDTQDPADTETVKNSQMFSGEDSKNLYNIATQKIFAPEISDFEPYDRETLAVSPSLFKDSKPLVTSKVQKCSETKCIIDAHSLTEDTQDPFLTSSPSSALQNEGLKYKETNSSLTGNMDNCFNAHTQKHISVITDHSLCKKELAVASVPCLEDEDCSKDSSESSQGLFSIKTQNDSCSSISDQNPYDVQTLIMSSSLSEEIQDPFSVETQIASPSEVQNYERVTLTTSSVQQDKMRPIIIEEDVQAFSVTLNREKENHYLNLTQRDAPDSRPCDKKSNIVSSKGDNDSNEWQSHSDSEIENQNSYLLPTQIDNPQHTRYTLTSTPIEVIEGNSVLNVQTYFPSTIKENDPFNAETLADSSPNECKQNNVALSDLSNNDSNGAHQLNQSAKIMEKSVLISNVLQSIKKNRPPLTECLIKHSLQSTSKISSSTEEVNDELNSPTQNLQQSPYFKKLKKDPFVTETFTGFLPYKNKTELSNKQVLNDSFSVTGDIKPTFFSSEQLHEDKITDNQKMPVEYSHDSEMLKYIPSSQPKKGLLSVSQDQNMTLHNANNERHIISDPQEVIHTPGSSSMSLKSLTMDINVKKQPNGEALSNHKSNFLHLPSEISQDSSSSLKRHMVRKKDITAKRKCMKTVENNQSTSSNKELARKRHSKDIESKINNKRIKLEKNPPQPTWITANKDKNSDKRNNVNLAAKNISKPKRKRCKSSGATQSLLTSQVEKAKLMQQHRFKRKILERSNHDQKDKSSVSEIHDDNNDNIEDVEMPSTQDMMKLGLPILSARLPVSKKHLALGLPSQGRVASEEKGIKSKDFQDSGGIRGDTISLNVKKINSRKETLPPVPTFNLTPVDRCTSRVAETSLPTHTDVSSEDASSSTTQESFLGQSFTKEVSNKISESEPNKQITQPQIVTTFRSHEASLSETIHSTIPVSVHSEISAKSLYPENLTSALQAERINFQEQNLQKSSAFPGKILQKLPAHPGQNLLKLPDTTGPIISILPGLTGHILQTLPGHSRTELSISKGILKLPGVYNGGSKILPKVTFSSSNSEVHLPGRPHFLKQDDDLKLKERAKLFFLSTVLNWNPLWLKEREANQSLPELFGSKKKLKDVCSQLRLYYTTFKEYVDITLNLLVLECWETIYRDGKMFKPETSVILEVHCEQAMRHPSKLHQEHSLVSVDVIGLVPQRDRRNFPTNGDVLFIDFWGARKVEGKYEEPCMWQQFCLVKCVKVQSIDKIKFLQKYRIFESSSQVPRDRNLQTVSMVLLLRNKGIIITPTKLHTIKVISSSFKMMERQIDALTHLQDSPLHEPLLSLCNRDVFFHQNVQPSDKLLAKLNTEQATAVATIMQDVVGRPLSQKVFLLQGPPGTGKSHTILALIHQILVKTHFKARICLATPSNAAVDEIAKRIINFSYHLKKNGLNSISLVRIGNKNKVQQCIKEFMWDDLVDQILIRDSPQSLRTELNLLERRAQELKKCLSDTSLSEEQRVMKKRKHNEIGAQIAKLKKDIEPKKGNCRERYNAKCQILDGAHVICGTLSSFGSDDLKEIVLRSEEHRHKTLSFTCLIIDEATQAIEVDSLIPLQYKVSKVVLVGDQEQLPATVLSQMASEKLLTRSLFERIMICIGEFFQKEKSPVMMLTRQYRMHSEILSLPNSFFYDCQLKTDESVLARKEIIAPYLVFDIQTSRETRDQNNRSILNVDEAVCIAQLCEIVKQKINDIGVICPYTDQQNAILSHLKKKKLEVEVHTVDSFQGQERDVIILSCVRAQSNPTGIGFVADRKRMNVALTRAKHALYVIGHFNTLCTDDLWKQLYRNATDRKLLVRVTKTADFIRCAESAVLKRTYSLTGASW